MTSLAVAAQPPDVHFLFTESRAIIVANCLRLKFLTWAFLRRVRSFAVMVPQNAIVVEFADQHEPVGGHNG